MPKKVKIVKCDLSGKINAVYDTISEAARDNQRSIHYLYRRIDGYRGKRDTEFFCTLDDLKKVKIECKEKYRKYALMVADYLNRNDWVIDEKVKKWYRWERNFNGNVSY